jgi:hypothetical protein
MRSFPKWAFVVLMIAANDASAQSSAIPWSAWASGGTISASTVTRLRTVMGQPAIGQTRSSTTLITGGFLVRAGGGVTGVARDVLPIPDAFALMQNYPNPFNPSTVIGYSIPGRSHVNLTVFNSIGQQVAQLVDEDMAPGHHEITFAGSGLASGVYFYRIRVVASDPSSGNTAGARAGTYVETKKFVLLR